MTLPIRITFRDMAHSSALETYVRRHCDKLERLFDRITSCHVTIAMPHQHSGRPVRIAIDLMLPGQEIVINRGRDDDEATLDAHAAIDRAFDQAARRIQDHVRHQRGDVKPHESAYQEARVSKLWNDEDYGFLTTDADLDVYFHRKSVLHHAFDRLEIGSKVRFIEEQGDKGPQASSVALVK
ncbi:MAG TPA: HPF/RaiA family ribosome-associated protein [Polyangiaceae bacterium]|nr:HPF/RaiA family ribosome-associated protein [Polyangiaceae bacterium]